MNGPPRAPRDRRYSTNAWRRVRDLVRERDQHTCQACGRREPAGGRKTFPVDHKVPGADFYDPAGLWLLCWSCNTSKAGMSVDEWRARAVPKPGQVGAVAYANPPKASPLVLLPQPQAMTYPYHEHHWGPRRWQVMGIGDMDRPWPRDGSCPPDCIAYRRESV